MEIHDLKSAPPRDWRAPAIPYPAIQAHGLIGDRRTAALVAGDGTVDWLCLPDFDGGVIFGALLDCTKGGYWRLGPALRSQGEQTYLEDTAVLATRWELDTGSLELSDAMLWPEVTRAPEQSQVRALVRSLRCTRGKVACQLDFLPGHNFEPAAEFTEYSSGFTATLPGEMLLRIWASSRLQAEGSGLHARFELQAGEEVWSVLELGAAGHGWSVEAARSALEGTKKYWRDWLGRLTSKAAGGMETRRAAMAVHLLTYAPDGSVVAAPTASLPERIGGSWNADYRLSWVRDTSLSLAMLSRLGDSEETERYLHWLTKRLSRFGQPLQILYDIHGGKRPKQRDISGVDGYRGSRPVRTGNHAYKQRQFGSYGFLTDCIWVYLQEGGRWREEYWPLVRRCANYVAKHWTEPDNGIWELSERRHYVHSKVLCWVALDRAVKIAQKVDSGFDTQSWQDEAARLHAEVMDKGWSERLGAFRQAYDAENLDAAALLIPVMDFLPGGHPRVLSTIEQIAQRLTVDGFVYRFDPLETPGIGELPLGQFEGAFLPCTFWLATALAKAGQPEQAGAILARAEKAAGTQGLFSEAVDPRNGDSMGNTPLLFSHVEYVRAKLELAAAKPQSQPLHEAA